MAARALYGRLPEGMRSALRSVWYRLPFTPPGRRERWVRDVYVRALQDDRRRLFLAIANFRHVNRPTEGYYFEFGCHGANTMRMAWDSFHRLFELTYVGFDSFEGLPEIAGIDRQEIWRKGALATSEAAFRTACERAGMPRDRLLTVPGFYDDTLTDATAARFAGRGAAVVYVDCDLYESTVPVLRFVRPFLREGTVIVFGDWNCFNADPDRGERRAFREFRERHPELRFEPFAATAMQQAFVFVGEREPA
ncbi:MAG: TylF/MycF/NovP-related O-methyltransferase [Acetobacterales bacterium]